MASTSSVQNPPTTQPNPITLSRYLTENTQSLAKAHSTKGSMYFVASVICAIAAVAILGSITAVYLGLATQTGLSGGVIIAAFAGFCASMQGVATFSQWKKDEISYSENYQLFANRLSEIKDWTEDNVKKFFRDHSITMNRFTDVENALLIANKPQAPLTTLLPLIARYLVTKEKAEEVRKIADAQRKAIASIDQKKPEGVELIKMHQTLLNNQNRIASYFRTEAAFYLQCLQEPTLAARTDHPEHVFQEIKNRGEPKYSLLDKCYNRVRYGANPNLNEIYNIPEMRRVLFA